MGLLYTTASPFFISAPVSSSPAFIGPVQPGSIFSVEIESGSVTTVEYNTGAESIGEIKPGAESMNAELIDRSFDIQMLDPVDVQIVESSVPDSLAAGERVDLKVMAEMEEGWHLYSIHNDPDKGPIPTRFDASSEGLSIVGEVRESQAEIAYDPNFDTELGWHSGSALFSIPVQFDRWLKGPKRISLDITYQTCDDRSCLPPVTKTVSANLQLLPSAEQPAQAEAGSEEPAGSFLGLISFMLISGVIAAWIGYKILVG